MKVAIFGLGVVGSALDNWLCRNHEIRRRDPALHMHDPIDDVEMAFVCVPTPSREADGALDLEAVEVALRSLDEEAPGQAPVVIRSTLWPGATDGLQATYPAHPILYVPEFLTEATATEDQLFPSRHIIGVTETSRPLATPVLELLAEPDFFEVMPARAAEVTKLATNAFYATKVTFFNQLFELCARLGVDYEQVRRCMEMDPMAAAQHMDVHHGGYRGFGGKCLPKDTLALLATFLRGPADGEPTRWQKSLPSWFEYPLIRHAMVHNEVLRSDRARFVVGDRVCNRCREPLVATVPHGASVTELVHPATDRCQLSGKSVPFGSWTERGASFTFDKTPERA